MLDIYDGSTVVLNTLIFYPESGSTVTIHDGILKVLYASSMGSMDDDGADTYFSSLQGSGLEISDRATYSYDEGFYVAQVPEPVVFGLFLLGGLVLFSAKRAAVNKNSLFQILEK